MSSSTKSIAAARQRRAGETAPIASRTATAVPQRLPPQTGSPAPYQKKPPMYQPQQSPLYSQQQQGPITQPQSMYGYSSQQTVQVGFQQQQQLQQQQLQQQVPLQQQQSFPNGLQVGPEKIGNGPGQLSISNAFALVTLRLGKVETFISKLLKEGLAGVGIDMGSVTSGEEAMDSSAIHELVSRIETLESQNQQQQVILSRLDVIEQKLNDYGQHMNIFDMGLQESKEFNQQMQQDLDELRKSYDTSQIHEQQDLDELRKSYDTSQIHEQQDLDAYNESVHDATDENV